LRGGIDSLVLFNLNRQAGLTVRTEHRGERGVLEVGVGGVVAGEEAKSVPLTASATARSRGVERSWNSRSEC
jgi:hypothetical protein